MNNYYRFSTRGFANGDRIVSVDINCQADRALLAKLNARISESEDGWIDRYRLREVQDLLASRRARQRVGLTCLGTLAIEPIADLEFFLTDYCAESGGKQ